MYYETREKHPKEYLKTRYYIATFDEIVRVIRKVCETLNYRILNEDLTRREIFVEGDCSIVITISPFGREQGIDLNVDTYTFFDFGKGKRRIKEFYAEVAKHVSYKGVGLHG